MKQRMFTGVLLLIAILTVGCSSPEPHPIDYGIAQCVSCLMSVTDTRFGAEAVSTTGKTYVFDSPECMFGWYLAEHDVRSEDIHSLWVTDHAHPATLIDANTALYLHSEELRSPMSMNVAAFHTESDLKAAQARYGGSPISMNNVLEMSEDYK